MLHQSVKDAWRTFSEPLEGRVAGMYLDILGLVTCAVGILIDPIEHALSLPWKRDIDGMAATEAEIRAAWALLKSHQEYAHRGTAAARALTKLHLDEADIDELVADKVESNAQFVAAHYFPFFEKFPADAQLGIMSMAWAVGPGFPAKFQIFKACVLAGDWLGARDACTIRETGNPGVVPRNAANRVCFANAEIVSRCGIARDVLRWPAVAQADVPAHERAANLGTLVGVALDDARTHADEVSRLEALRNMSDAETQEGRGA